MPKFFKTNFKLLLTCNSILEVSNFIRKESLFGFSTFSSFNYKTSILKNYVKSQTNCRYLMVASSDLKNYYTVSLTKPSSGQNFIVKGKEGDSILDVVKNNDLDIPGFGACDGTISCSTCHLIFKKEDFGKIDSPITDDEIDMLTLAKDCCDTRKFRCLSFSGSGFLGLYLIGAAEYMQKHQPDLLASVRYAGSSAGALVASGLACNVSLDSGRLAFLRTTAHAQESFAGPFASRFHIQDHLREGLENLPKDAHLKASGRLFVSLTRVRDLKNVIISEFKSREELIETILCSCFIPGFSGTSLPSVNGTFYIDGGFTNNLPTPFPETITVCPYPGSADISPAKDSVFSKNNYTWDHNNFIHRHYRSVFPSSPDEMMVYYWEGHKDAEMFLKNLLVKKSNKL